MPRARTGKPSEARRANAIVGSGGEAWRARAVAGVLATALATGCFDRGLAIEVDVGDTSASKVELYLGKTRCDPTDNTADIDCTSIAPPDGTVALRGTIWFRDSPLPYTADVKGHTATFQLQADTATTLPIVVAVGLGVTPLGLRPVGTATLLDLAIPVGSARIVTTSLTAAGAVLPKQTDTKDLTADRVMVWAKSTPPSSCVVLEHWDHGQVVRDFVVPDDDPDCDDLAPPECNPAAYRGSSAIGGAATRPDCVAPLEKRCVLGAFGCTDVPAATTDTCIAQPRHTCLPEQLCQCTALAGECIQNVIDSDPTGSMIPHLECDVPTTAALGACSGRDNDIVDLSQKFPAGCGRQPLLSSLQLTGVSTSHKFGNAEFELSGASEACMFKISWKSGLLPADVTTEDGFVGLDLANGGVLVPIVLRFRVDTCLITPFHCRLVDYPTDSLWSCAP
jgi:hypothetical protein